MRQIDAATITETVAELCIRANCVLGGDVLASLRRAKEKEESPLGREVLQQILENAAIAREEQVPVCQDTGLAVVWIELGQEVHITGGDFERAIHAGVSKGYKEGYLRPSVAGDPFDRKNTGDNTPAIIHVKIVPGDRLKITVAPKGGGSENMSACRLLKPADGVDGVIKFVVETVKDAGPNPCPPVIVGVGIGGTVEFAAMLAKKSLLRPIGQANADPKLAAIEQEILQRVNNLGIGPQGLGGRMTALAVHVETYPVHIATLPVVVNFNCHAARHATAVI